MGGIRCRVSISDLQARLRDFAAARDWERFHTPKNLTMALSGEVGELTEIFQWLTPQQSSAVMSSPDRAAHVQEEMADVLAYLLRLADVLGVDLEAALVEKIAANGAKYPIEASRGRADKYNELGRRYLADKNVSGLLSSREKYFAWHEKQVFRGEAGVLDASI